MLKQYGLDPALLHNWDKFRFYYLNNFGFTKGRWILGLPDKKSWRRLVYNSLKGNISDTELSKVEIALRNFFKEKVVVHPASGVWDTSKDWLTNAENEYDHSPFDAIVTNENPRARNYVITDEEIEDTNPSWNVSCQNQIVRIAQDMAASIQPILQRSRTLIFIDPHFKPRESRYKNTLEAFLSTALQDRINTNLEVVEFHLSTVNYRGTFEVDCNRSLPRVIDNSILIKFKEIAEKPNGEKIHDRYILTDIGGVKFSVGLDEDQQRATNQTTGVDLLEDHIYQQIWFQYMSDTPAFDTVNEFTIQGIKN